MAEHSLFLRRLLATCVACALAAPSPVGAIQIVFDYRFDTNGFFDSPPRRDALEAAADVYRIFTDNLTAINPGTVYNPGTPAEFTDTWNAVIDHPGQTGQATVVDMAISSNTMIVFAGAKNLSGSTLAFSGPGGYTVNGIQSFVTAVSTRGQPNATGQTPTDYGRWGGAITFDAIVSGSQPRVWHTDLGTTPPPGALDLFTVAVHELGHLFGFASSSGSPLSFQTYWNQTSKQFTGPKVVEVYGGYAPTASDGTTHWKSGLTSTVNGVSQAAVMGPSIPPGVRRQFTALDYAAMADIGWQVPDSVFDVPLPGDYDGNGIVNNNDYTLWRNTFGSTTNLAADGNWNGRVDAADYTLWRDHLGSASSTATAAQIGVPEPSSGLLVAILVVSMLLLNRGKCNALRTATPSGSIGAIKCEP